MEERELRAAEPTGVAAGGAVPRRRADHERDPGVEHGRQPRHTTTHSDYTFEHSVEVAIVATLLGRHLGLPIPQIRELALGALLHDIGKISIDQAILNKPAADRRTAEIESTRRLGFEWSGGCRSRAFCRPTWRSSITSARTARLPARADRQQRILRLEAERLRPSRIVLIAEIAAVADVFCALASERPYKPAFPLDRVRTILDGMAGDHLNRDVVTALLRVVPMYAVGHWVEVTSGEYEGWRGVVTEIDVAGAARAVDPPAPGPLA